MTDKAGKITKIVYKAIDELNEQLAEQNRLEKALETPILGSTGRLDSVGFVNLIVLVEDKCQEEFGLPISLTEDVGGVDDSAFKNIGNFINYLCRMVEEQAANKR